MTIHNNPSNLADPIIGRVRHETRRRTLTVTSTERITPNMLRIELTGDDLADFVSGAPDDHIKLIFPADDGATVMREYTPRRYDNDARTLVIDFAVHDSGPATLWALAAKPGDSLEIGGPRGSRVVTGDIAQWLMIGDETALPAIGRRLEEAAPGTAVTTLVSVPGKEDEQAFDTQADLTTLWVHRAASTDPAPMIEVLGTIELPPRTFVWIAAEGSVTRELRRHLTEDRGHPLTWLKASGYWVEGKADSKENFD